MSWAPGITLREAEKQIILSAMKFFDGHKINTAKSLGIAVRTLDNKLAKYSREDKR